MAQSEAMQRQNRDEGALSGLCWRECWDAFGRVFVLCVVIAQLSMGLSGCHPAQAIEPIAPASLSSLIAADEAPLILDVRTAQEYAQGHVPGAINIDHRQVGDQLEQIRRYGRREIVVYCELGVRASRAEAVLQSAGFEVRQLSGHMQGWRDSGFPIGQAQNSAR